MRRRSMMVDGKRGTESRAKASIAARSKPRTSGRGGGLSGTHHQAQQSTKSASDISAKTRTNSESCLKFIQSFNKQIPNSCQARGTQEGIAQTHSYSHWDGSVVGRRLLWVGPGSCSLGNRDSWFVWPLSIFLAIFSLGANCKSPRPRQWSHKIPD